MLTVDGQQHQGAFAEKIVSRGKDAVKACHRVDGGKDGSEASVSPCPCPSPDGSLLSYSHLSPRPLAFFEVFMDHP